MTLEELLNSLIQRGWKPFGITCTDFIKGTGLEGIPSYCFNPHPHMGFPGGTRKYHRPSLIQIVSKESGLWQFVCENGMYKKEALGIYFNDERAKNVFYKIDQFDEEGDVIQTGDMEGDRFIHMSEPEYRLIESSLRDESELEDFLLQNIKVEGNEK